MHASRQRRYIADVFVGLTGFIVLSGCASDARGTFRASRAGMAPVAMASPVTPAGAIASNTANRGNSANTTNTTDAADTTNTAITTDAGPAMPRGAEWPANVTIPSYHRATIARMWQASPTFRRQCVRIGQAARILSVDLRDNAQWGLSGVRAHTIITRGADAPSQARVLLNVTYRSAVVELIAHEFEHILEWLDGVDYASGERTGQVRPTGADAVETRRAIALGLQVAREVEAAREPAVVLGAM